MIDLSHPRRIHVVGVGGSGMSAIAEVLASMGHAVSGSDQRDSGVLAHLAEAGVATRSRHEAAAVAGAEVVAVSSAVPTSNVEVVEALRLGIPVVRRAEILAAICSQRRTVAVAGTHGKTTTSSMLAAMMQRGGFEPSYVIGGSLGVTGTGAAWARGEWLVVEADESDGTFLELGATAVVVTSVEPDHLDHYGDFSRQQAAFARFVAGAPGPRVISLDDPGVAALARGALDMPGTAEPPVTTYGTSAGADYHMSKVALGRGFTTFDLRAFGTAIGEVKVPVPGVHNARNACGALAMAAALGVGWSDAVGALDGYKGVRRRFERRGEAEGVTFVDDYGHLPGEVKPVLEAARAGGWQRVVVVFQPHRYSRTEALWADFADAFVDADVLVVTDVYPAGEPPRPGVSGALIANAIQDA
ncbi:MAG: UDP-N-acetylmuramate--L-alanine ligase, partial [Acidimicrobiales bacterium]